MRLLRSFCAAERQECGAEEGPLCGGDTDYKQLGTLPLFASCARVCMCVWLHVIAAVGPLLVPLTLRGPGVHTETECKETCGGGRV